jgi:Mrp family chromosome partitioning ATPase
MADIAEAVHEAGDGAKRVAVVAGAPGVDATQSAIMLARTLARASRVVLVDLALEQPKVAAIAMDPRSPGIADLVHGSASFGQIITRDRFSRVQVIPAGRVGADAAAVYKSERLGIAFDALARTYDHVIVNAGAATGMAAERIARLAPCAVLIASGVPAAAADAARGQLVAAGFADVAVFTGTLPALDVESAGVAA